MDRMACVDVAAFPLQQVLRDHPDWAPLPVAVVEADRPQAAVLFLNAHARRLGVRTGQRYATALSIARNLRATTVSDAEVERGVHALADRLRRYSPHVEPSRELPGVFWLDASGLGHLYPSLEIWAELIRVDLQSVGMMASVAVGFSRFGAYALAVAHRGVRVCADAAEERMRVHRVPLARMNLDPGVRDRLLALGVEMVGDFLRLPGHAMRTRFGAAADRLHRLASGTEWAPLVPAPPDVHHRRIVEFDAPERNVERLVFIIKRLLDALAALVARLGEAIVEVELTMTLDDRSARVECVRPAAPTLDVTSLLTLVRLRLETLQLPAGMVTLRVQVNTCRAMAGDRPLLADDARRDAGAANQALARLRAECGDDSVVRACLRDAHLPSARFAWEPLVEVTARASPRVVAQRSLVRRIYAQPPVVARQPAHANRPGPYVLSGGWWAGGVRRDYYFVPMNDGGLWWIYYDHRRRKFFLQGRVE